MLGTPLGFRAMIAVGAAGFYGGRAMRYGAAMLLSLSAALLLASEPAKWRPMDERDRSIIAKAVGDTLMDGESARFRWPLENPDGALYCGFVNAKNVFGAYTGFQPFMVMGVHANGPQGDGRYSVVKVVVASGPDGGDASIIQTMCAEEGFDLSVLPPE